MSSDIILCGVVAIALLRGALLHEMVAQRALRRLEQELHLALTLMLATRPLTAAHHPDSTAGAPGGRLHDSRRATVGSVRRTRRMR
ncbi:MAG: hypothetical protein ACRDTH_00015 [Pseudonocardiaceae bacterium]